MALPLASELGTIRSADGWSYRITPDDLLWLARSAWCEGGEVASTLWTYAQRMALYHSSSMASMLRAHSQPISPAWDEASDPFCIANPERCSDASLARRLECRTASWDAIPSSITSKVAAFAQAQLANPVPKATDFADATVSASFIRRNPGTVIVKRVRSGRTEQWYLAEVPALRWPANFVSIAYGSRIATAVAGGLGLVGFGIIALVAWRAVASVEYLGRRR